MGAHGGVVDEEEKCLAVGRVVAPAIGEVVQVEHCAQRDELPQLRRCTLKDEERPDTAGKERGDGVDFLSRQLGLLAHLVLKQGEKLGDVMPDALHTA
jgi:hypothetical protein